MMDAFLYSIVWHYMVFARTGAGEIWRIWFDGDGGPKMEQLRGDEAEWFEPLRTLANLSRPGVSVHENNPDGGGWVKDMFVPSGRKWLSMDGDAY